MPLLLKLILLYVLAPMAFVAFVGIGLYYVGDIDSDEPILKTKYRERYNECIESLPRDKDCVISDVTLEVIDKQ